MKYIHPTEYFKWICGHTGNLGIRLWFTFGYYKLRKKLPNISRPTNLSEFIISNILDAKWNKTVAFYADKCAVRSYIEEKGYNDTLLQTYGEWASVTDIDIATLPEKFALKANNGCGNHIFCNDKIKFKLEEKKEILEKNMSLNNIMFKFEPHYSYISPKIYAEELMNLDSTFGIIDYKFFCVRGKICGIQVIGNRHGDNYDMQLKNEKWENIEGLVNGSIINTDLFPKPNNFDKMKKMARDLSKDFDFVRVDLYEYQNEVKFGEMTFTPGGALLSSFNLKFLEMVFGDIQKNQ